MTIKKEQKKFQDYTLEERKVIWDTLKEALDEAGHDIMTQDVIPNLPEDEKEYMESEQFHGIAFDPDDFKDVYVINIINGNMLDAGESIDFDKIIEQGSKNRPQEEILQETPTDISKKKTKKSDDEIINNGEYIGDTWYDGTPGQGRHSRYYKYNDKFYEYTYGSDEYSGLKEVDVFVMTHPKQGYEQYSEYSKKSKTKKSLSEDNYTFMGKPIGNCIDIADYIRTNRPDILDQIAEDYNVDVTDFDALVDFFVDTYQVFDEYEEYGITYRSPDLIMSDMEQELWHEPSGKVNWDKLRVYDELYNEMYGTHFIGSPELLDNEEARNITDAYRSYIAWNNHGNEPHWMEFPDSIFYAYTDPEEILTIMEEQGELEDYEEEYHTKAIVDALRSLKKGKNMEKTKTTKAQILYGMMGGKHEEYYKRIIDLAEQYCPHATKIYAGFSTDIVWDLPSGNHPGLFISTHGGEDNSYYVCSMTAYTYLDFPEITPDGNMPAEMGRMAEEMYNKSNGGGLSEDELIRYMKEMDNMCAELQNVQKSKTNKGETKIPVSDDDTVEIEEMDGKKYVEIEPKEEHAEEVETGYEKESDDLNTEDNITHPDTSKPKETEKSKTKKSVIDFTEGMTLKDFFEKNKRGGNSIMGFDLYSVDLDGKQVGTNYTGVKDYADYIVDSYDIDDMLGMAFIHIHKSNTNKTIDQLTPAQAVQVCMKYQIENKRNGLMQDEVYELTGYNAESLFQPMMKCGRVIKHKCADGFIYDIRK